MVILIFYTKS